MAEPTREKVFLGLSEQGLRSGARLVPNFLNHFEIQALTLQQSIGLNSVETGFWDDKRQSRVLNTGQDVPFKILQHSGHVSIEAAGCYVYGGEKHAAEPEYDAGIRWALSRGIPFYFVEGSEDFPSHFFAFKDGNVRGIPFEADRESKLSFLYQKKAEAQSRFNPTDSVQVLNLFAAVAVNQILNEYDRVAHIGGTASFEAGFKPEHSEWLRVVQLLGSRRDLELGNLVQADRKEGFNLNKGEWF